MEVHIETVDDLPLIYHFIHKLLIDSQLDFAYPIPKNWSGLSVGNLTEIWLTYIVTSCNHRLSHVEDWAEKHLGILNTLTNRTIRREDFCDDKLGSLLEYFSDTQMWNRFMDQHNQNVINVFNLATNIFRVDATIGKSFKKVVEDGLFQMGSSKQFRPDLAQFKLMLATLDPIGQPIASLIVSGEHADDPLYIPVIKQAIEVTGAKKKLFVGDKKMSSLETRSYIVSTGNYYLSPLSVVQVPEVQLLEYITPVLKDIQEVKHIYKGTTKIAKGFELSQIIKAKVDGNEIEWQERRLIVRSYQFANSQIKTLVEHVEQARCALLELNERKQGKPVYSIEKELQSVCDSIVNKVSGIVEYIIEKQVTTKQIRAYKDRLSRIKEIIHLRIDVKINEEELNKRKSTLGWRVYATNSPESKFTLEAAVLVYRNEYIIEHCFQNLKNAPIHLLPLFLHRDDRIKGLINLMLLALSIIRMMEYKVKNGMKEKDIVLKGLYPGNPKQKCLNPSADRILSAFDNMHCSIVEECSTSISENEQDIEILNQNKEEEHQAICEAKKNQCSSTFPLIKNVSKQNVVTKVFVTPLTFLQITLLDLLGLTTNIYTDLEMNFLATCKIIEGRALYNLPRKVTKIIVEKQFQGQCNNFNSG